jgi:hypothetical protein
VCNCECLLQRVQLYIKTMHVQWHTSVYIQYYIYTHAIINFIWNLFRFDKQHIYVALQYTEFVHVFVHKSLLTPKPGPVGVSVRVVSPEIGSAA